MDADLGREGLDELPALVVVGCGDRVAQRGGAGVWLVWVEGLGQRGVEQIDYVCAAVAELGDLGPECADTLAALVLREAAVFEREQVALDCLLGFGELRVDPGEFGLVLLADVLLACAAGGYGVREQV